LVILLDAATDEPPLALVLSGVEVGQSAQLFAAHALDQTFDNDLRGGIVREQPDQLRAPIG